MYDALREQIVTTVGAYLNAHPSRVTASEKFRSDTERILGLRDSIVYRFESLAYHIDLLLGRERACLEPFRDEIFRRDALDHVRSASRDMKFLFDDLVFSAASLFDYFGNAIGFLLLREPTVNKKWGGVRKWAVADQDGTQTAEIVRQLGDEWIRGMIDYRNGLIHEESDTAGGAYRCTLAGGSAQLEIRITAPRDFTDRIQYLRDNPVAGGLRIMDAGLWLVGQTYDAASALTSALAKDLGLPAPITA